MIRDLERKLYNLDIPLSSDQFLLLLLLTTFVSAMLLYIIDISPVYSLVVLAIVLSALEYMHNMYVRQIEDSLPRYLHYVSTLPLATVSQFVKYGREGFGALSREFKRIVEAGGEEKDYRRMLRGMAERLGSPLIERVIKSVLIAFEYGKQKELLKGLAEELYFVREIEQEKSASVSLHRYSLIVTSFLVIPFILANVVSMVNELGTDISEIEQVIPYYLVVLSLITASYVGVHSGNYKNLPVYFVVGTVISLGVYYTTLTW